MIPHIVTNHGTVARVAVQCSCPDTKKVGDFLFTAESHKIPGTRCSPIFSDLAGLLHWIKQNGWMLIGLSDSGSVEYIFEGTDDQL